MSIHNGLRTFRKIFRFDLLFEGVVLPDLTKTCGQQDDRHPGGRLSLSQTADQTIPIRDIFLSAFLFEELVILRLMDFQPIDNSFVKRVHQN